MSKYLSVSNTILSMRGHMPITDENGVLIYEAKGELPFISPTWRLLTATGEVVATVRKKVFTWQPTWIVSGELGTFAIKRKLFSFVRCYRVEGGPFNGSELTGNFMGLKFDIVHNSDVIAHATGKIFSLRDTHTIEIVKQGPEARLFTAIAMVTLQLDKRDEQAVHSSGAS